MITKIPKMLTANKRKLTEIFDFVHNEMSIPHHIIVHFPQVMRPLWEGCPGPPSAAALQQDAAHSKNALLFVKELDQTQAGSESCVKVSFFCPSFYQDNTLEQKLKKHFEP